MPPKPRRAAALSLALLLAAALGLVACSREEGAARAGTKARTDKEIERVVRSYLLRNPEVLVEVMQALEKQREAGRAEAAKSAIGAHRQALLNDPDSPVGGNPRGDVTIVEFFDYQCGYCRRVAPTVAEALEKDANLRIVYKEFPILGPGSVVAARAALAARLQNKYASLHKALMGAAGPLNEETVLRVAAEAGLDTERLRRDMASPTTTAIIERNHALARALQIRGTPAFVVGDHLYPGALEAATLSRLIQEARAR